MSRCLLTISYLGTDFCGWQVQPNGNTVQAEICSALNKIYSKNIDVTGCSRTDSGVHANMFCCHFDIDTDMNPHNIIEAINHNTSQNISAIDCVIVPDDFHARYSCINKNYVYKICNSAHPNPFENGRAMWYKYPLDVEKMNLAAKLFVGTHDFSAFCSAGSSVVDKVRTVQSCDVKKTGDIIEISITANGFLYNMVRIITGTLLEIGGGKRSAESITKALESGNRSDAGVTATACGLYLNKVIYKE